MSEQKDDSAIDQQTPSWGILAPPGPKKDPLRRFKFREIKRFLIPAGLYVRINKAHEYLVKDGVDLSSERDFLLSMLDAMVTNIEYAIFMREKEKANAKAETEAGQPAQGQDGNRSVPDGEVRPGSEAEVAAPKPEDTEGKEVLIPSGFRSGLE